MSLRPIRRSFESPWQNGIAERWIESSRRELVDHIIAVNECHLNAYFLNTSATTTKTEHI